MDYRYIYIEIQSKAMIDALVISTTLEGESAAIIIGSIIPGASIIVNLGRMSVPYLVRKLNQVTEMLVYDLLCSDVSHIEQGRMPK